VTLATPWIAAVGALAVLFPIMVHLFFRRRTHPVEWAAMDLLREAVRRAERHRKLKRLALLVVRCLALVIAGVAIAGPMLLKESAPEASTPRGSGELIIVLDDCVAQRCTIGGVTAFERSRTRALNALDGLSQGDRIGVMRVSSAEPLVWPPSSDLISARAVLQACEPTFEAPSLDEAIASSMKPSGTVCVVSEFRRGSLGDGPLTVAAEGGSRVVISPPASEACVNTQIVAANLVARPPNTPRSLWPLRVTLRREGTFLQSSTSVVEARCGESRSVARVEWAEGQVEARTEVFVQTPLDDTGEHPLRVSLAEPDAQPSDNTWFGVIAGSPSIHVGVITREGGAGLTGGEGPSQWIDRALQPQEGGDIEIELIDPATIDNTRLGRCDAVIILRPDLVSTQEWTLLANRSAAGLVVIVAPPSEATSSLWSDAMVNTFALGWTLSREPHDGASPQPLSVTKESAAVLARIAPELSELSRPILVSRWFDLSMPKGSGTSLLTLNDGTPLVAMASRDRGTGALVLFTSAVDLGWNNLPAKPLMVPLLQEIIRQSVASVERGGSVEPGAGHLGRAIPRATQLVHVLGETASTTSATRTISVDPGGRLGQALIVPGVYQAQDSTGGGVGWLVVNVNPDAARVAPTSTETVVGMFRSMGCTVAQGDIATDARQDQSDRPHDTETPVARALQGRSLAVWFFWALVGIALLETMLARFASDGSTLSRGGESA